MKTLLLNTLLFISFVSIGQSNYYDSLDINNINARFYSGGQMFSDTSISGGGYEFIQGTNHNLIYSSNLWMGGFDTVGQLKFAGEIYNTGDFFYGPMSTINNPGSSPNYDYVWKITRQEIDDFINWYQCINTPGCNPNPSYTVPSVILDWPAHANTSQGYDFYLAPFVDVDQNGIYQPIQGDYPCIKGDMAIFTVYHDYGVHTNSGGDMVGAEIKAMHYAFDHDPMGMGQDESFRNTIFSEYVITNKFPRTLTNFQVGLFDDMDIGCPDNDFIGSDLSRGLVFTHNAFANDYPANSPCQYPIGAHPPAQGLTILKGLKIDDDGTDNPLTTDIPMAINQNGIPYTALGCGYGDGMIDNEYLGLSKFMYFNLGMPVAIYGDPANAEEYYNYMNCNWLDNSHLVYGAVGHQSNSGATNIPSNYAFPGSSDPLFWSTQGVPASPSSWGETDTSIVIGDRRSLAVMGPITFQAGERYTFAIARITGSDTTGNSTSLNKLFNSTDEIRSYYGCQQNIFDGFCTAQALSVTLVNTPQVALYPNPTNGLIYFDTPDRIQSVSIYSVTGELIYTTGVTENYLDLSEYETGIYFLELNFNGNKVVKRVVKN